jgi:hypothetical protein
MAAINYNAMIRRAKADFKARIDEYHGIVSQMETEMQNTMKYVTLQTENMHELAAYMKAIKAKVNTLERHIGSLVELKAKSRFVAIHTS